MTRRTRVVLQPTVRSAAIEALAAMEGWTELGSTPSTGQEPAERVWSDGSTRIHCFDDPLVGTGYLSFVGPGAERMADRLRRDVPTITAEEIFALERAGGETEVSRAILYAALAIPEDGDPELTMVVRRGLAHPSPEVRGVAVIATAYAERAELDDDLGRLAADDPDPQVRSEAAATLDGLRRLRDGGRT